MANTKREPITVEIATHPCGCRVLPNYVHIPRWADAAVDGALCRCQEWRERMERAMRYRTYRAFSDWSAKHCPGPPDRLETLEVSPPVTLEELDALFAA